METTSKYFKLTNTTVSQCLNDTDDFKAENPVKNHRKPLKTTTTKKKKYKKPSKVNTLRRYTDNLQRICTDGGLDVDADHLQLAIALSNSVNDQSQPNSVDNINYVDKPASSGLNEVRKTLEQFGFKVNVEYKPAVKKPRRKNYPLLLMPADEKLQIILKKIDVILASNTYDPFVIDSIDYKIVSNSLTQTLCIENCCFTKAQSLFESPDDEYYVDGLIEPSNVKIGSLLKDWSSIPGREKSPERKVADIHYKDTELYKHFDLLLSGTVAQIQGIYRSKTESDESQIAVNMDRCDSPDIFADESVYKPTVDDVVNVSSSDSDEFPNVYLSRPKPPDLSNPIHNSSRSSSKGNSDDLICEDDRGIIHFESYREPSFPEQSPIKQDDRLSQSNDIPDVFVISDDEINYSIHHTKPENRPNDYMFSKIYKSSLLDSIQSYKSNSEEFYNEQLSEIINIPNPAQDEEEISPDLCTIKKSPGREESHETPKYVIKTRSVTPQIDYDGLSTPDIADELSKYGLKPLKRKRAVKILEHIYEQTHPTVDPKSLEGNPKRLKIDVLKESNRIETNCIDSDIYKADSEDYVLKSIHCDADDLIFQSREKAKIQSCRVPLHIVFHNYVCRRIKLREAILRFEPIDVERIYKDLTSFGYKYKPKDLMGFLDRKCIAIKTSPKNSK